MKLLIFLLLFLLFVCPLWADDVTHQLGNSGYAVREAMIYKANVKSSKKYWEAVSLQSQAQQALADRDIPGALEFSRRAEVLAKQAYHEARGR